MEEKDKAPRSSRRRAARKDYSNAVDSEEDNDDDANNDAAMDLTHDDDDEEMLVDTDTEAPTVRKRVSTRPTRFRGAMPDAAPDLPKSPPKSPARRHHQRRRSLGEDEPSDEEHESGDEEAVEHDEEDEPLVVQRIIAKRTETKKTWHTITQSMNTSEIHYGSRWFQPEPNNDAMQEDDDTLEERFLVKWSDLSFLHCSWETKRDLLDQTDSAMKFGTFARKSVDGLLYSADERCDGDFFDPGFTQIQRIMEVQEDSDEPMIMDKKDPKFDDGTGRQFLIKWCNLPYTESTYEFERDLVINDIEYKEHVDAFLARIRKPTKSLFRSHLEQGTKELRRLYKFLGDKTKLSEKALGAAVSKYQQELQDRVYKNGGQLRDYQAEGVSWMISNFVNQRSCILADEMGLGKTLQTAATVDILLNSLNRGAPVLIIAPLSTLTHWQREFQSWTDLNTIIYHGNADDRRLIREHEFVYESDRPGAIGLNQYYLKKCASKAAKGTSPWMVNVVITTPEVMICDDSVELTSVKWEALIVDEAHRLKNYKSKLAVSLRNDKYQFRHRILLTGTPIQNDVQEFWTILNFVDPEGFDDMDSFNDKYGKESMKSKERVDDLHEEIRPYILRRLKEDVEKSVPPKEETLIEVELTNTQKQYYRALYEKNVKFLHKSKRALDGPSLSNLAMQLRKCCNHLFLLNGVEEELRNKESSTSEGDFLAKSSGKLVLLDKLLPRLKEQGHRVLVFSQFKIMLDILEDYFVARGTKFERIDGSITGNKRQQAIDRFQAPETDGKESPFVMMLSTRAGGVGINLTAADTCIIFDSDWNPQNDLQAQARCHRIGQTKLLTRKTYEMQMFHMSSLKMGLDKAVLNGFESGSSGDGNLSKEEIERLLRHGAYEIFNEDKAGEADKISNEFIEQDIDSILERRSRTVVHDNTGTGSSAAGGTFSKASFKARSPDPHSTEGDEEVDVDDPDFWKKFFKDLPEENEEELQRGKRQRNQQNYSDRNYAENFERNLLGVGSDDEDDASVESTALEVDGNRLAWGGLKDCEWRKSDVESMVKFLCTFGYCDAVTPERLASLTLKDEHSDEEKKRMMWSIVLLSLVEFIEEDAESVLRRETKSSEIEAPSDGVLASKVTKPKNGSIELKEKSLQKFVTANRWLDLVFNDVTSYARNAIPRAPEVTSLVGLAATHPKVRELAAAPPKSMNMSVNLRFENDLWPALEHQGWTTIFSNEKTSFTHPQSNMTLENRMEMLEAAKTLQPGLTKLIDAFLKTQSCSSNETEARILSIKDVKFQDLAAFVSEYGSIQLAFNGAIPSSRINLSKKALSVSLYMYNASELLRRSAQVKEGDKRSLIKSLSKLMDLSRRTTLPHKLWTSYQDAALIFAISKHGWLDQEVAVKNVVRDVSIPWGDPFDRQGLDGRSPRVLAAKQLLCSSGKHAAAFLSKKQSLVSDTKGFNRDRLVATYGLFQSTENPMLWQCQEVSDNPEGEDDSSDLPPKKDLVRRAKVILSRLPTEKAIQETDQLAVLEQSTAHTFLEELLRGILRETARKNLLELYDVAIDEVGMLEQACGNLTLYADIHEMQATYKKIIQQLEFAKRHSSKSKVQAKNIVRATLGEATLKPRRDGESAIPTISSSTTPTPADKAKTATSPYQRISSKTMGKKAIETARKTLFETFGGANPRPRADSHLYLTEVETLIVTIAISFGLPVWVGGWKDLLEAKSRNDNPQSFSWNDFHSRLLELAQKRAEDAKKRANKLKKDSRDMKPGSKGDPEDQQAMELRREAASNEFASSVSALEQIEDYKRELDNLAKKTIMLLAKIHQMMAIPGKSKNGQSNQLGQDILTWMRGEVRRWADSFGLLGEDGHPLAYTAAEFLNEMPEEERVTIEIATVFEKTSCYHVASQMSSLTRIRALLLFNPDAVALGHHLDGTNQKDAWAKRPTDWSLNADVALLYRLTISGFSQALLSSDDTPPSSAPVPTFLSMKMSKGQLQCRADQLVLELHKKCSILQERKNDEIEMIDESPMKRKLVKDENAFNKKLCPS